LFTLDNKRAATHNKMSRKFKHHKALLYYKRMCCIT